MVRYAALVLMAIGLVTPWGCADRGVQTAHEVRLIAARPYEPDVPVPGGFELVDSASEDRSTGVTRLYLRHVYEGRADKYAVRNFYREQMPLARWSMVSDGNVKGDINMRFEKGAESCTVLIADGPGRFSATARIQVIVAREDRGQVPLATRTRS